MQRLRNSLSTDHRWTIGLTTNNDIKHTHNLYIEFIQYFFWIDGPCTLETLYQNNEIQFEHNPCIWFVLTIYLHHTRLIFKSALTPAHVSTSCHVAKL